MDTTTYRKAALERLSSPEQIDDVLRISTSKEWIAMLGIVLVLATVGVWAVRGTLPAKAPGSGVLVRAGGLLNVVTLRGGLVLSIDVKLGDTVRRNQVVARVAQPMLLDRIASTRLELDQAKGDREAAVRIASSGAALQGDAITVQRENARREIQELHLQADLAAQQIPVVDQLLAKGLVTTRQTIAARQTLVGIQQQIAARQGLIKQYDAQEFAARAEPQRADVERREKVRHTALTLASLEQELALSQNVVTPSGGQVIELQADPGSVVSPEAPILTIQPDAGILEVMVCVPSHYAKNVAPGMVAEVSPSSVKREEFGFIRGIVTYVADYPATSAALMRSLQNEQLVKSLTASGPVTEIKIQLDADRGAPSGLRWSSSRGPALPPSSGTLCSVQIVTRQQRPIELLLPYTKKAIGLD